MNTLEMPKGQQSKGEKLSINIFCMFAFVSNPQSTIQNFSLHGTYS
jgi:hypothetical protein